MSPLVGFIRWLKRRDKNWVESTVETVFVFLPLILLIRTYGFGLYQVPTGSMETTMLVGDVFIADKFTILFRAPQHGDIISFNDPNYIYSTNPWMRFWEDYFSLSVQSWTKRVIGVPGDHVKGVVEDGRPVVYVNGIKLDEPYLNQYPIVASYDMGLGTRSFAYRPWDPTKSMAEQPFYFRLSEEAIQAGRRRAESCGLPGIREPHTPLIEYINGEPKMVDEFDVHLGSDEFWVQGDNRLGSYDSRAWGPLKKNFIHGLIRFRIASVDPRESWMIVDVIKHPIDFISRIRWSRFLQPVL